MNKRTYWTYKERHPMPRGTISLSELLKRALDHLDDIIIEMAVSIEFRRIYRRNLLVKQNRQRRRGTAGIIPVPRQRDGHVDPVHRHSA